MYSDLRDSPATIFFFLNLPFFTFFNKSKGQISRKKIQNVIILQEWTLFVFFWSLQEKKHWI